MSFPKKYVDKHEVVTPRLQRFHKFLIACCFRYVEHITVLLSLPLFIQYGCGCFIICTAVLQLTIMVSYCSVE